MNYCANNTLTHYTTKFPKITDLDGTWEIGLAEIQYPHSIWSCYRMGTIPRPKRFPIEGKRHMKELKNKFDIGFNEINHKIDLKVKKDYQVIISPLLQSMLGFRQAIFPGGRGGGGGGGGGGAGGGVCFRLGSGPHERIKFSVHVLSLGGTENGGRCPSTVIENRTGGRKRRRNDHQSV